MRELETCKKYATTMNSVTRHDANVTSDKYQATFHLKSQEPRTGEGSYSRNSLKNSSRRNNKRRSTALRLKVENTDGVEGVKYDGNVSGFNFGFGFFKSNPKKALRKRGSLRKIDSKRRMPGNKNEAFQRIQAKFDLLLDIK